MGVLVRMAGLMTIRAFVDAKKSNPQLNHLIVTKLRAPSDGGWLEIAQRLAKDLEGTGQPIADLVGKALKGKGSQALSALIKFRNDLLHGETILDEHQKSRYAIRGGHSCLRQSR